MEPAQWYSERLPQILLPKGGYLAALEAFFDESERPGGVFCVAGYVFTPLESKRFGEEWRRAVGGSWPFHMAEFAAGKDKVEREVPFEGMSEHDRRALQVRLVNVINRRMTLAVSISCKVGDIQNLNPGIRGLRSAYSVCCYLCLGLLADWITRRGSSDRVAYLFESGHRFRGEADFILGLAGHHEISRHWARYGGHAYGTRNDSPQLQAADLYAWELSKFLDETVDQRKRPMRESLKALVRPHPERYEGRILGARALKKYFDEIRALKIKGKEWYRK